MIPDITTICNDLKRGLITLEQAIHWLQEHKRMRDEEAAQDNPLYPDGV